MIIRMHNGIVPLVPAQYLNCTVGNHLVGIHINGGSCAPLNRVYNKSIMKLALQYFITSFYNRLSNMLIQQSGLTIGDRRCLLNLRQTVDNLRVH